MSKDPVFQDFFDSAKRMFAVRDRLSYLLDDFVIISSVDDLNSLEQALEDSNDIRDFFKKFKGEV